MGRRLLITTGLIGVLAAASLPFGGRVRGQVFAPDQVQSAFLFRFVQHSTWPVDVFDSEDSPIRVAVLGLDGPVAVLQQFVAGETIHGRHIEVVGYTYPAVGENAQAHREEVDALFKRLERSHVLYVSPSARQHVEEIVRRLEGGSVLTVADVDVPGAAGRGIMLGFVLRDNRIKFEANLRSIRRAKVKVSPDLLKLPVKTY